MSRAPGTVPNDKSALPQEKTSEPSGSQKTPSPRCVLSATRNSLRKIYEQVCCIYTKLSLCPQKVMPSSHGSHFLSQKVPSLPYTFPLPQGEPQNKYSRCRQRAMPHISCHHLQVWDHKSSPLPRRQPRDAVRTIHKTWPSALYSRASDLLNIRSPS